jgi:hypothetical protein
MKKILIVTYYYAPYNQVGGIRATFFANYFTKYFSVDVIKADDSHYYKEVNPHLIYKSKVNIHNIKIPIRFNKYLHWLSGYYTFKKSIQNLLKLKKIDLIFFSGGPFFYFPLGNFFLKKYQIPFILDYRDNYFNKPNICRIKSFLHYLYFKHIIDKPSIKNASYIVNVSNGLTKLHQLDNEQIKKNYFITILNGYNDYLIKNANYKGQIYKNQKKIKLGIFGKFAYYNQRHVDLLLRALILHNKKEVIKLHLYIIGEKENYIEDRINTLGIQKYVKLVGNLNYKKGVEFLANMNILILNHPDNDLGYGTKIFDYILLNKPIIAFTELNSETDKLLKLFKNSYICSDINKFNKAVDSIIKSGGSELGSNANIKVYSRSYQAHRLVNYIKKIMNV